MISHGLQRQPLVSRCDARSNKQSAVAGSVEGEFTDRGVRTHILTKKIASKKQLVRGHRLQCPRLLGQNNYYLPRKVITETTISMSVSATCRPGT